MKNVCEDRPIEADLYSGRWHELACRVLKGHRLTEEEGLAILRSGDEELLDVLAAAYRVRHHWHGNRVLLSFLVNAKSGRCAEDCAYCSQSGTATSDIPKYSMLDTEELYAGAEQAALRQAGTYCIVIARRSPTEAELDSIAEVVPRIKAAFPLEVCTSLGLLSPDQAARLKASGVDRVNHNLNTSRRFYPQICTTHTYDDRLETLRAVRAAGLEICSGGIVGMGEEDRDVVELALQLGALEVESLPINFLIPINGTGLASQPKVSPRQCLRVLALFRLANPKSELRMAAGRELRLGSLQPLGLYAANSLFVGDYLTTKGQPPQEDYQMIEDLGFEAVVESINGE
ncbi:MAG: biotin synthase BioB [Isosphaeraceae bacterium]